MMDTRSRKAVDKGVLIAAVALAGGAGLQPAYGQDAAQGQRPNVLLISIDDLRPDLGSYGHPLAVTPSLDQFARTSLSFDRAYVQQAICAASRAALMTGLRPDTTGIITLEQPVAETVPDVTTLNKLFKQNGYETISIGKIYHHRDDDAAGWSKDPYDVIYDFRRDRRARGIPNPPYDAWELAEEELPDARNIEHALLELERLSGQETPFFLAVGLHRPHLPFRAPASDWRLYDPATVPGPSSTSPAEGSPEWAVVSWEVWNYDGLPPQPGPMPADDAEHLRHGYLATITYADRLVGRLLDQLTAMGRDEDTIVVVWSDHGFKLGDHGAWAKHSNVELDIHIPMMIRVPGMPSAGTRTEALVESVDIYPTLIELAGLSEPQALEGASLLPLIEDPARSWKEAAFAQYHRFVNQQPAMGKTVRTQRYRYTAWVNRDTGRLLAQELYDHDVDPHETLNVAGDSRYRDVTARHERLRRDGWRPVRDRLN